MGRPINKRFFGTSASEGDIRVRFKTGGTEYNGYIVRQKGSKKFVVTDGGSNTATCTLTNKADASLDNGEMTIKGRIDAGTVGFVSKIDGRTCVLVNTSGTTIGSGPWAFGSSLADGFIQFEEQGGTATGTIRGNVTAVTGNVDL